MVITLDGNGDKTPTKGTSEFPKSLENIIKKFQKSLNGTSKVPKHQKGTLQSSKSP
jgi:hypothetical protein